MMRFLLLLLAPICFQVKAAVYSTKKISHSSDTLKAWDVVMNEIMADPDPPAGSILYPEYVELYNRRRNTVNLKNWKFCVGTTCKTLADVNIPPDSFLVLTAI